jgi:predicted MFS family arabinose efflux permease
MALLAVFGALGLARFSYASILPSMQAALGLSNAQAGSLATADLSGYLLMSVLGGVLAGRIGPRRVISAGLLVCTLGLLLTGVSWSYAPLCSGGCLPASALPWPTYRRRP